MEFIDPELLEYCEAHTSEEDSLLKRITRETQAKVLMPRMLSGQLQGKFLELMVKMHQPKTVLEIGTYTGYSAICMARGLSNRGKLITLDINDELEKMVRGFFEESGLSAQIDYRLGNALDLIPSLEGDFDFVFIDADKENYLPYYQLVIDRVSKGGVILPIMCFGREKSFQRVEKNWIRIQLPCWNSTDLYKKNHEWKIVFYPSGMD